jgi:hypothetical protein
MAWVKLFNLSGRFRVSVAMPSMVNDGFVSQDVSRSSWRLRTVIYSAWSKSMTTLSVMGKLWQLNTKPRAIS